MLLNKFLDIFAAHEHDCAHTDLVQHHIDTGDAQPIHLHPRCLPLTKRVAAENKLREMLEAGVIEPSDSLRWSPVVLVKKRKIH